MDGVSQDWRENGEWGALRENGAGCDKLMAEGAEFFLSETPDRTERYSGFKKPESALSGRFAEFDLRGNTRTIRPL
jgi:hypothetical protein